VKFLPLRCRGEAPSPRQRLTARHEVAPITVKPARAGLHPLFHQRFPTGACVVGNNGVRSCRNNETSSLDGRQTARGDGDC